MIHGCLKKKKVFPFKHGEFSFGYPCYFFGGYSISVYLWFQAASASSPHILLFFSVLASGIPHVEGQWPTFRGTTGKLRQSLSPPNRWLVDGSWNPRENEDPKGTSPSVECTTWSWFEEIPTYYHLGSQVWFSKIKWRNERNGLQFGSSNLELPRNTQNPSLMNPYSNLSINHYLKVLFRDTHVKGRGVTNQLDPLRVPLDNLTPPFLCFSWYTTIQLVCTRPRNNLWWSARGALLHLMAGVVVQPEVFSSWHIKINPTD